MTTSSTFIIRVWTSEGPAWRGQGRIDHVQSGEYRYFDELSDALAFLRRHFGAFDSIPAPPADPDIAADQPPGPPTSA